TVSLSNNASTRTSLASLLSSDRFVAEREIGAGRGALPTLRACASINTGDGPPNWGKPTASTRSPSVTGNGSFVNTRNPFGPSVRKYSRGRAYNTWPVTFTRVKAPTCDVNSKRSVKRRAWTENRFSGVGSSTDNIELPRKNRPGLSRRV